MAILPDEITNIDQLRTFVLETLCQHEQLDAHAFRMTEQTLIRAGQACGLYFCLHGPRAVKFSAIWENQRNTVLFYNSSGERFLKVQVAELPEPELAVA